MEAVILFPAIDLKNGQCVRLEQGDMARATVFNLDPAAQARAFAAQGFVKPPRKGAYDRAAQVQQLLTETGKHRSAGPVDLLIAATAERERLIVLCDDRDYQAVAAVTGQPVKLVSDI